MKQDVSLESKVKIGINLYTYFLFLKGDLQWQK